MTERVTVSGRLTNLLSRRLPKVMNFGTRLQARVFERSGGRRAAKLRGKPVFRLTVVGRTSLEPRTVMLMLVRQGDDLLVCGSQGGAPTAPNWWKNLEAAGRASAQVGGDTFDVDLHVVTDPAERSEAWAALVDAYPDFASYQALTERVLPIGKLTRRS